MDKYVVFQTLDSCISCEDASTIFSDAALGKLDQFVNYLPANKPKGGELLLFRLSSPSDDIHLRDHYNFWNNGSKIDEDVDVKRTFWRLHVGERKFLNGFRRETFTSLSPKCEFVLVQYIGDEKLFVRISHGNSKGSRVFTTVSKRVIRTLTEAAKKNEAPKKIYFNNLNEHRKDFGEKAVDTEAVLASRNIKQVKNLRQKLSRSSRISNCEIYSLFEMSKQDFGNAFHKIVLFPHPVVIFSNPAAVELARRVLRRSNDEPQLHEQLITADCTFNLTDAYVTALVCRNIEIEGDAIFPIVFMFHETKQKEVHLEFWRVCNDLLNLKSLVNLPIATDRETAMTDSLLDIVPKANLVFCFNHILENIKTWLRSSKQAQNDDFAVLMHQTRQLLLSESLEEFGKRYEEFRVLWTKTFLDYFDKHLLEDIKQRAARYQTSRFLAFTKKLPTNNLSESLNKQLKEECNWKELPMDALFLLFFQYQSNIVHEFNRSLRDIGSYHRKKFASRLAEIKLCGLNDIPLQETVKRIKAGTPDPTETIKKEPNYRMSQKYLASLVLEQKLITYDTSQYVFVIRSPFRPLEVCTVQIQPNGQFKCICPSSGLCYHIISAMKALRLQIPDIDNKTYKLSTIEKKSRKKEGKSGRKKPRPRDVVLNVKEADDSISANKISSSSWLTENSMQELEDPIAKILTHSKLRKRQKVCSTPKQKENHGSSETVKTPTESPIKVQLRRYAEKYPSLMNEEWLSNFVIEDFCTKFISCSTLFKSILFIPFYVARAIPNNLLDTPLVLLQRSCSLNFDIVLVLLGSDTTSETSASHWMLGVINFKHKEIFLLDSINAPKAARMKEFGILGSLVSMIYAVAEQDENYKDWSHFYATDVPKQRNSFDCGVFTCMFVECIVQKKEFFIPPSSDFRDHIGSFLCSSNNDLKERELVPKNVDLIRKIVASRNFVPKLFEPKEILEKNVMPHLCSSIDNMTMNDTTCAAGHSICIPDVSLNEMRQPQVLCVGKCRSWYHTKCLGLIEVKENYFLCNGCK